VADANFNSGLNRVTNVEFICGRAEETLPSAIYQCGESKEICAIIDPPREGMHKKALRALRSCERIEQIVYVSCNPRSMSADVLSLMRHETSKRPGRPFRVHRTDLVDMFPHTEHCEAVVLLKRCSAEEASRMRENCLEENDD
jgi:tRNA (uracil-5-)-methyltransferase